MTIKKLDQKILDAKLTGQLLVNQFVEIFGIDAGILNEKIIDDTDFNKDRNLHFKMLNQLQKDIESANLSKVEKGYRARSVLAFEIKYLETLEKLLKLAKSKNLDEDIRWKVSFEKLVFSVEGYRTSIATLEEYLQNS